ncbi:hypothetical protein WA158_001671 [Blastocystis sp. Blastoise]
MSLSSQLEPFVTIDLNSIALPSHFCSFSDNNFNYDCPYQFNNDANNNDILSSKENYCFSPSIHQAVNSCFNHDNSIIQSCSPAYDDVILSDSSIPHKESFSSSSTLDDYGSEQFHDDNNNFFPNSECNFIENMIPEINTSNNSTQNSADSIFHFSNSISNINLDSSECIQRDGLSTSEGFLHSLADHNNNDFIISNSSYNNDNNAYDSSLKTDNEQYPHYSDIENTLFGNPYSFETSDLFGNQQFFNDSLSFSPYNESISIPPLVNLNNTIDCTLYNNNNNSNEINNNNNININNNNDININTEMNPISNTTYQESLKSSQKHPLLQTNSSFYSSKSSSSGTTSTLSPISTSETHSFFVNRTITNNPPPSLPPKQHKKASKLYLADGNLAYTAPRKRSSSVISQSVECSIKKPRNNSCCDMSHLNSLVSSSSSSMNEINTNNTYTLQNNLNNQNSFVNTIETMYNLPISKMNKLNSFYTIPSILDTKKHNRQTKKKSTFSTPSTQSINKRNSTINNNKKKNNTKVNSTTLPPLFPKQLINRCTKKLLSYTLCSSPQEMRVLYINNHN